MPSSYLRTAFFLEIAAPFQGASGRVAVLWLGYKTRELLAQPS